MPAYGLRRCLVLLAALTLAGLALAHQVCRPGVLSPHCGLSVFRPVCYAPMPSTQPCVPEAYMIQDHNFFLLNLKTGQVRNISRSVGLTRGGEINSIGYNIRDRYIYGVQRHRLVRITSIGALEDVAPIPWRTNIGEFDDRGQYWFSSSGRRWGRIDLVPGSSTYGQLMESGISDLGDVPPTADWAYTPRSPGYFYGIGIRKRDATPGHPRTVTPVLVRWSTSTHLWQAVYEAKGLLNDKAVSFGAVMATRDGIIYGVDNKRGSVVRFDLVDFSRTTHTATGPASQRNDGTRCMLLPDS